MNSLNEIVRTYLKKNGLTTTFFAQWIGADRSQVQKWFAGERKLSQEQIHKVWEFLNGEFLTSFDQIVSVKKEG